jgi:hypothetical protein
MAYVVGSKTEESLKRVINLKKPLMRGWWSEEENVKGDRKETQKGSAHEDAAAITRRSRKDAVGWSRDNARGELQSSSCCVRAIERVLHPDCKGLRCLFSGSRPDALSRVSGEVAGNLIILQRAMQTSGVAAGDGLPALFGHLNQAIAGDAFPLAGAFLRLGSPSASNCAPS